MIATQHGLFLRAIAEGMEGATKVIFEHTINTKYGTNYAEYESYPLIATKNDGWEIIIATDIIVSEIEMIANKIIEYGETVRYGYISVEQADKIIANNISIDINNRIN